MRIEQGFGRFNVGETVNIILESIQYTKGNHRPYARCTTEDGQSFNVNVKDSDSTLKPGRYQLKCTSVNEQGYCYVELTQLQHSSWDKHDEVTETLEKTTTTTGGNCVDIAYNINLTRQYREKLKVEGLTVEECQDIMYDIDEILKKLYLRYGICVIKQMEDDDLWQ